MDNKTACEIICQSTRASDFRKDFICAQDALHGQMLNTPWPVLIYAASVLFVMFLVQRASEVPHKKEAQRKAAEEKASREKSSQEKPSKQKDGTEQ